MAPVKRSMPSAQRETRATKAATVAKKKTSTTEKKLESVKPAKPSTTATTAASTTARRAKKILDEEKVEQEQTEDPPVVRTTRSGVTQTSPPVTGMTAAPRRRVKITPLDKSTAANTSRQTAPTEDSTKKDDPPKKNTTRSKTTTRAVVKHNKEDSLIVEQKPKSTRKTTTTSSTVPQSQKMSTSKPRGQPKAQKSQELDPVSKDEPATTLTTRATRSRRAGSVLSDNAALSSQEIPPTKTVNPARKKVTFQDLPALNDKENQPLPSKGKKMVAQRASEKQIATGMRAKPVRKTITATSTTSGRKPNSRSAKTAGTTAPDDESEKNERKIIRVLTPKKITQVAKSSSPEHEELETSDGEDELNRGKTPVRDLSLSPRRPPTAAIARALSPAKKLNFEQSLLPKSPERTTSIYGAEAGQMSMFGSPARRPAGSPFKDSLKDSPKRGLQDTKNLLFPHNQESSSSIALNLSTGDSAGHNMSTMLQSPKRVGHLDTNFFSQSAMKKSASKPPFKSSLLGTPAKRLFSPSKRVATSLPQNQAETHLDIIAEPVSEEMELEGEVSASSHFRSSASPLRVMRMELDNNDFDFDDSVLQIRSPLKVQHALSKIQEQKAPEAAMNLDVEMPLTGDTEHSVDQDQEFVQPSDLDADSNAFETAGSPHTGVPTGDIASQSDAASDEAMQDMSETKEQHERRSIAKPDFPQRRSLSQILFRSHRNQSDGESSEDELARDQTPEQTQVRKDTTRPRHSTGIASSRTGIGFGFTPLAAQMSGWLATSPEKSPIQVKEKELAKPSTTFSPLAQQHIDGEVIISRDSTPVQKLRGGSRLSTSSSSGPSARGRRSMNLRKSLLLPQTIEFSPRTESPGRNAQFEEYMEIRAMEEQEASSLQDDPEYDMNPKFVDHSADLEGQVSATEDPDETILAHEDESSSDESSAPAGDLTTDLINFTHASDTAMVDFQKLAAEANGLASEADEADLSEEDSLFLEDNVLEKHTSELASDELSHVTGEMLSNMLTPPPRATTTDHHHTTPVQSVQSPSLQPFDEHLETPSMLAIDQDQSTHLTSSSPVPSPPLSPSQSIIIKTPQPNLRLDERRLINTVVSKVPLKPEGCISPIKMPRKRSRSFGTSDTSPAKRISFEDLKSLPSSMTLGVSQSPDRRMRTSTAPSPGGTSTPAVRKVVTPASKSSVGGTSTYTTPGQMSFAIDDFGDSTLDGIEIPEDFEDETNVATELDSPARLVASMVNTPTSRLVNALPAATPATATRKIQCATTPGTTTSKTPLTARKSSARAHKVATTERAPLEPVGQGVLHGATVFVDVFTSEGADASGIFIELLTQMGAKCVKEWRWNPRASLASELENESTLPKTGITHVVFKDGSKRTLEKVRDAKGEVCCVGVTWVLDSERENKWLDESSYQIDTSVLPRGGSKRRKSMEPRALLVANDGSVSRSRARRSVSGEMNELMRRELLKTPARGQVPSTNQDDSGDDENDENTEQATPTGYVAYDPRVAMTPGTPYLVSQGKKLTQMSAPPKQSNKSLFDDENEENEDTFIEGEKRDSGAVREAKKFRMKNLGDMAKRRRTLGFKPAVGSPLSRH